MENLQRASIDAYINVLINTASNLPNCSHPWSWYSSSKTPPTSLKQYFVLCGHLCLGWCGIPAGQKISYLVCDRPAAFCPSLYSIGYFLQKTFKLHDLYLRCLVQFNALNLMCPVQFIMIMIILKDATTVPDYVPNITEYTGVMMKLTICQTKCKG